MDFDLVIKEKETLDENIKNLSTFIKGCSYNSLSTFDKRLLQKQRQAMLQYTEILKQRLLISAKRSSKIPDCFVDGTCCALCDYIEKTNCPVNVVFKGWSMWRDFCSKFTPKREEEDE